MPLTTDPTCIFCKIAASQIPSFNVYEDDQIFAFLDIAPLALGHTLIIPKSHHATLIESPPEILSAITTALPKIASAVLAATGASACHFLINNGPEAMQSVPHLHFHIIPRSDGDTFRIPWNTIPFNKQSAPTLQQSIQSRIK